MNRRFVPRACLAALAALAVAGLAASAQAAPAPKAPAYAPKPYKPKSKRDFTGLWERVGGIAWEPDARGPSRHAPLTPEYQKIFSQRLKDAAEGKPTGDPTSACLPQGMPRIMTMTYPMEVMQNETQVNIFAEWNEQTRRIFIDGRPHPPPDELDVTYYGHSIGHWEGNVLVADTVGIRGDTNLEASGLPHSDALTVKERIWLADDNTLKDEITLVDPKAYTHPWTVTKTFKRMEPGATLLPYVCLENQRNPVDQNGVIGFVHEGGSGKQ
jgi:hypothetical protein